MDCTTYRQLVNFLSTLALSDGLEKYERLRIKRQSVQYFVRENILYRRNQQNPDMPLRVITTQEVEMVLSYFHTDPLAGHFGWLRTYQRIMERFFWPNMRKHIYDYVQSCDTCQRRGKPLARQEPLHPIKVGQPFDRVGIDILGPLPLTPRGNRFIIVATDYLTKWPEALATPNEKAKTVAKFLMEFIITRHGAPKELLSDQGKMFACELVNELCQMWEIRHVLACAYHPQTNGLVERFNKTLATTLGKLITKEDDWDLFVDAALFAYRTARQETTKHTPFFLLYGREATFPLETQVATYPRKPLAEETVADTLLRRTYDLGITCRLCIERSVNI